jgi:hypothetical protein
MTITEPAPLDQYTVAWVLWAWAAIQLTPVTAAHVDVGVAFTVALTREYRFPLSRAKAS